MVDECSVYFERPFHEETISGRTPRIRLSKLSLFFSLYLLAKEALRSRRNEMMDERRLDRWSIDYTFDRVRAAMTGTSVGYLSLDGRSIFLIIFNSCSPPALSLSPRSCRLSFFLKRSIVKLCLLISVNPDQHHILKAMIRREKIRKI